MLSVLLRALLGLGPGTSVIKRDLTLMHSALQQEVDLIPWTDEETELLSINEERLKLKKLRNVHAGVIHTIFHEPLVKYAYKHYRTKDKLLSAILLIKDSNYSYIRRKNLAEVYLDGAFFGRIESSKNFYLGNGRQAVCSILPDGGPYHSINIGTVRVGQIININHEHSKNPRALVMLRTLSQRDMQVLKALALFFWLVSLKKI